MRQFILLQTYVGLSGFTYDVTCNGRELDMAEAKQLALVDDAALARHKRSSYLATWYEVRPGDVIRVRVWDEDSDDLAFFELTELFFIVPAGGLVNPPTSLDDDRTGRWLHQYLEQQCPKQ